jgi:UDP-2,3-diacylglucosamine pyrophosphatase LpxH
VVQNVRWLAFLGDVGYQFLLKMNAPVNFVRRLFGLGHWSLSAAVKKSVKEAVSYIGAFESGIAQLARRDHVDGVICGHIHTPTMREIDGVGYFNCGDWVESTSALLEDFAGKIELLTHFQRTFETAAPLPIVEADEIHPAVGTMEAVTKN